MTRQVTSRSRDRSANGSPAGVRRRPCGCYPPLMWRTWTDEWEANHVALLWTARVGLGLSTFDDASARLGVETNSFSLNSVEGHEISCVPIEKNAELYVISAFLSIFWLVLAIFNVFSRPGADRCLPTAALRTNPGCTRCRTARSNSAYPTGRH